MTPARSDAKDNLNRERAARERAAFLAESSRLLAESLDYETTLATVAQLALPHLGAWCFVDLVGPGGEMRRLAVIHPDPQMQALATRLEQGWPPERDDPFGVPRAVRTRESEIIPAVTEAMMEQAAHGEENLRLLRQLGIGSLIVVPLLARGDVLGAITYVAPRAYHPYTDDDLALAEDLAARSAVAIDNARLYRAAHRRAERLERLHALSEALLESLSPEEVLRTLVTTGREAWGAAGGFAGLLREDGACLEGVMMGYPEEFQDRWSQVPVELRVPVTEVIRTAAPLFLSSRAERDTRFPETPGPQGMEAIASAPLVVEGRTLGAWTLHFRHERAFTDGEREFFATLTRQCAQALERARLYAAEHQARAEAEEANRAKTLFLSTMSHELRTPLNAIAGYAELLEIDIHGPLSKEQRRSIRRIQANQRHLLGLVNSVLDYAKIESGRMEYQIRDVSLADVMEQVEPLILPLAQQRGVEHPGECIHNELVVRADPEKLQQILTNLVVNAIKFTPPGGRVGVECVPQNGDVAVRVTDTGIGIAKEHLDAIFQPFVQVQEGRTRKEEGTGLGLAISRNLARGMGGDLTVESELGKGSTFTLVLPRGGVG